jgi:hypothetical protein
VALLYYAGLGQIIAIDRNSRFEVNMMKRYLCFFATMLLVLAATDMSMGGMLFRFGAEEPQEISTSFNSSESKLRSRKLQNEMSGGSSKELGSLIEAKSCDFVWAAFNRDKEKVESMLVEDAEFIITDSNSSYIRYASGDLHVEGYMATDKKLLQVRQAWYVTEEDGTITSGVEVAIEGEEALQVWYIHYMKSFGQWKVFMLENGV